MSARITIKWLNSLFLISLSFCSSLIIFYVQLPNTRSLVYLKTTIIWLVLWSVFYQQVCWFNIIILLVLGTLIYCWENLSTLKQGLLMGDYAKR